VLGADIVEKGRKAGRSVRDLTYNEPDILIHCKSVQGDGDEGGPLVLRLLEKASRGGCSKRTTGGLDTIPS